MAITGRSALRAITLLLATAAVADSIDDYVRNRGARS